jgi:hypothetical protein
MSNQDELEPVDDSSTSSSSSSSNSSEEENDDEIGYEEHEIEEDINTNLNKRKRSWVWNHFTRDEITKKARCNYCKVLIITNKGSTTGMINHVKNKHKITQNNQENQNRQLTLQESINNSSEIIVSSI